MAMAMARNALLLHGTTMARARQIASSQALTPRQTYFAMGMSQRDLAREFARRAALKWPREGGPALVLVSVPESVVTRLRNLRLLVARGFDPGDRPQFVNRIQWVLEPGGVGLLNQGLNEIRARRA